MENLTQYLEFLGSYADIPVDEIVASFKRTYGRERVEGWIESFEKYGDIRQGRFDSEDASRQYLCFRKRSAQ